MLGCRSLPQSGRIQLRPMAPPPRRSPFLAVFAAVGICASLTVSGAALALSMSSRAESKQGSEQPVVATSGVGIPPEEKRANEQYAQETFRRIWDAERSFMRTRSWGDSRKFLTLESLVASKVVGPEVLQGAHGYTFIVAAEGEFSFTVAAVPSRPGVTGDAYNSATGQVPEYYFFTTGGGGVIPYNGVIPNGK